MSKRDERIKKNRAAKRAAKLAALKSNGGKSKYALKQHVHGRPGSPFE